MGYGFFIFLYPYSTWDFGRNSGERGTLNDNVVTSITIMKPMLEGLRSLRLETFEKRFPLQAGFKIKAHESRFSGINHRNPAYSGIEYFED